MKKIEIIINLIIIIFMIAPLGCLDKISENKNDELPDSFRIGGYNVECTIVSENVPQNSYFIIPTLIWSNNTIVHPYYDFPLISNSGGILVNNITCTAKGPGLWIKLYANTVTSYEVRYLVNYWFNETYQEIYHIENQFYNNSPGISYWNEKEEVFTSIYSNNNITLSISYHYNRIGSADYVDGSLMDFFYKENFKFYTGWNDIQLNRTLIYTEETD